MVFLCKEKLGYGGTAIHDGASWLDQQGAGYNRQVAQYLSTVVAWSYSDSPTFQNKLSQIPGLARGDYVELSVRNEALLVVATAQIIRTADKKSMILCFRGTELTNLVNWFVDANTEIVRLPGKDNENIHVHKGFLRNFQEVWNGCKGVRWNLLRPYMTDVSFRYDDSTNDKLLEQEMSPQKTGQAQLENVFICGHSLGTQCYQNLHLPCKSFDMSC